MSKKTTLLFKSLMVILKNATIIIPLIEGVINTIYGLTHHEEQQKEKKDESFIEEDKESKVTDTYGIEL